MSVVSLPTCYSVASSLSIIKKLKFHLTCGLDFSPGQILDSPSVVFVYPKSGTPGCVIQAREFAALYPEFCRLGVAMYGLSMDSVELQKKFKEDLALPFELISDPNGIVCEALGALKTSQMYGKTRTFLRRGTYIFTQGGNIQFWLDSDPTGQANRAIDFLQNKNP